MDRPRHGGDLIAEILAHEGVTHLFTTAGGHHAPILDGCRRAGIRIVDFRHQQAAVHAADGWARLTRSPGVAAVTAGPGVTNAVTAVATAEHAGSPTLVLAGKSPEAERGMRAFHELEQADLMSWIASWTDTCTESGRIAEQTLAALQSAIAGRGASFLDIPLDVFAALAGPAVMPAIDRMPPLEADPAFLDKAARLIATSQRPVVLAGSGVHWAHAEDELVAFAEALGVPVVLTGLGRGCLPPSHQCFVTAARKLALAEADLVLALGVEWSYQLGFGRGLFAEDARVIQVDPRKEELGRNRPVDVGILGDERKVLAQLLDAGAGKAIDPSWLARVRAEEERLFDDARAGMESDAVPIHPQRFAREIRDFLDADAIVIGDGGDIVGISASIVQPSEPGHWLDPGPFAALGVGSPFAIAAKLARPDAQVLVIQGDGSFGLSAMEYESAIRQDIPFVGIIGNDGAWGQVRVAQETLYGEGNAAATSLSQETGYEKMVEALGGHGERVTEPDEIRPALERAFASGVPACINVLVDPALMTRSSYLG